MIPPVPTSIDLPSISLMHAVVKYAGYLLGGPGPVSIIRSSLLDGTTTYINSEPAEYGDLGPHGARLADNGPVYILRNEIDGANANLWDAALAVTSHSTPVIQDNTITDSGLVPGGSGAALQVYSDAIDPEKLSGNTGHGNGFDQTLIYGTMTHSARLPVPGFPWSIGENYDVCGDCSLTIAAGRTVTLAPGTDLEWTEAAFYGTDDPSGLFVAGTLVAQGIPRHPVTIGNTVEVQPGGSVRLAGTRITTTDWGPSGSGRDDYDPGVVVDPGAGPVTVHADLGASGGIQAPDGQPVDATRSWWGSATGPAAGTNPAGTGAPVTGTGVQFLPFLTKAP
jgi:hypothetical protein